MTSVTDYTVGKPCINEPEQIQIYPAPLKTLQVNFLSFARYIPIVVLRGSRTKGLSILKRQVKNVRLYEQLRLIHHKPLNSFASVTTFVT